MTLQRFLLIAAVILLAVAWFISTGWGEHEWTNPAPWGYLGLTAFAGSFWR